MENYKDMILKLEYYKEQVINSFISKGYFPKNEDISTKLSLIETRTSLLKTYLSKPGSYFNTKEFNHMFEMVYKDLEILYKVLEDILYNEFNQLKIYTEIHLNELESKSNMFKKRLNEEMSNTSFGKNILFKTSDWDITTEDDITILDLGNIDINKGSKIALFANINNIENDNVSFKFIDEKDIKNSFDALPYNYNNDTYVIPGDKIIKESELVLNGRTIINDSIEMVSNIDSNNKYNILGGKNYMTITHETGEIEIIKFADSSNVYYATDNCTIEFYCYNNPTLEYSFNKKPLHCNFPISDGNIYINTKEPKKIYLNVNAGFMCYFNAEGGEIWASCNDAIITSDSTLLFNTNSNLKDFKMLEYVNNNYINYNIKVLIKSTNDIIKDIDNIYIKEIG